MVAASHAHIHFVSGWCGVQTLFPSFSPALFLVPFVHGDEPEIVSRLTDTTGNSECICSIGPTGSTESTGTTESIGTTGDHGWHEDLGNHRDHGDHGENRINAPQAAPQNNPQTLIGWSTGAHIILKHLPELALRYERVVLIAPFARFTQTMPERIVRSMIDGLKDDPHSVVRSFYRNCGVPDSLIEPSTVQALSQYCRGSLEQGLVYLIESQADLAKPLPTGNITVLHGSRDRIVRPKASAALMENLQTASRHIVDQAGHYISGEHFTIQS